MSQRLLLYSFYSSLLLALHLLYPINSNLHASDNFVIGSAAAEGISVSKRIGSFYQSIVFFAVIWLLLYFVLKRFNAIFETVPLKNSIDKLVAFGSLLGVISLFNNVLVESTLFIGFLSLLMLITSKIKTKSEALSEINSWIAIGLSFLSNYLLFHSAVIGGVIALLIWFVLYRNSLSNIITRIVCCISIGLPIIIFLGVEGTLILNQRGIFLPSYWILLTVFAVVGTGLLYFICRSKKPDNERFVFSVLGTIGLVSITLVHVYSPTLLQSEEMFESANYLNPVMQFKHFGEIPVIHNLSSHLVSDFFWQFTYAVLNGYHQDLSLMLYSDFTQILSLLAIYFFLRTVFGNQPFVLIFLLLFPAALFIIPQYYSLVLIPVSFLYRFIETNNKRQFSYFVLSVILVALWRLDLGVSLISTLIVIIPFWYYKHAEHRKIILLTVTAVAVFGGVLALSFIQFYPSEFKQLTGYFGANQAHGLPWLTYSESNLFFLDYYILPIVIAGVTIHTILNYSGSKSLSIIIITLTLFYFFNLQRGLVRHSFMEEQDMQILSFAWLIIGVKTWQLLGIEKFKKQLIGISIIVSMIALFLGIHKNGGTINSFQVSTTFNLKDLPVLNGKPVNRITQNPAFETKNSAIIAFLNKHLEQNQTFIDLSYTPLLYFYTGKDVPSYFNQYMQNTITDELQEMNRLDLTHYDIPLVVFSQAPESGFDNLDRIPNKVRHHIITKYIFDKYEPYAQIGIYRIWKRKDVKFDTNTLIPYPELPETWVLGSIPYFWKADRRHHFELVKQQPGFNSRSKIISLGKKVQPGTFLNITITSNVDQKCVLTGELLSIEFKLQKGKHRYRIPIGCSEQLVKFGKTQLTIREELSTIQVKNPYFARLVRK